MRFFEISQFDNNYINNIYTQSSGKGIFAFERQKIFFWETNGQATDGVEAFLQVDANSINNIDTIFINESNIANLNIYLNTGSGYNLFTDYVKLDSKDLKSHYFKFNSTQKVQGVKITGSNTLTANEEKKIVRVLAFKEIGRIEHISKIDPTTNFPQVRTKLLTGESDIIQKSSQPSWEFTLRLKNHYIESDITMIEYLKNSQSSYFIWIQDTKEDIFKMPLEPFRFQDIYKVALLRKTKPSYSADKFFGGYNDSFKFVEVA